MKKTFVFCLIVILFTKAFSQDIVLDKDIALNSTSYSSPEPESFPIVNYDKDEIVLFLMDKQYIRAFKFNMNYEPIDNFMVQKPKNKFPQLLGHSSDTLGYNLFYSNWKKNEFLVKSINVKDKKTTSKQIPLKLKGENFLESISYKNKFYILSLVKSSSIIKIYVFEGNSLRDTHQVDYSDYDFSDTNYSNLYQVLEKGGKITKMDNSDSNPLGLTSKENKLYCYDNKIYISIDNSEKNTKILTISLEDFNGNVNFYNHSNLKPHQYHNIKSNSYLFQDKLYQIIGNPGELCIQVSDINTKTKHSEYRVKSNEEIEFSNSAIIQESNTNIFKKYNEKVLTDTKNILYKISLNDIGISARLSNKNFELTIGAFEEIQRGGGIGGMTTTSTSVPTMGGTMTMTTSSYNPTMYGYYSYANSKSVYFKSLLDDNFDHITGTIEENAFDKIRDWEYKYRKGMTSQTLFKVGDSYVLGYYKKYLKKYYLIKFQG